MPLGCLCPVFKGAKKMNQQQNDERNVSLSLAVLLLVFSIPALLGCVK